MIGEAGQVLLYNFVDFFGFSFAIEGEDILLLAEIVVAVADGVIVAAYDDEFHIGISHGVTVLSAVMGDADDFAVTVEIAESFDDDRHIGWVVVDFGVDSLFDHVGLLVHGFVEFLDGEFCSGVEAFHGFSPFLRVSKFAKIDYQGCTHSHVLDYNIPHQ